MEFRKNDLVTLEIEDCGIDGEGIGKADGFTVFVKDAVIGDTVTAKIIKAKKNYGYGRLMEVLKPSPYRVEPKCEFARQCGGCQLQALSYDQQLVFKTNKVKGHLERIGGFTDIPMEPIIGMDELFHYRNKAQFPVGRNKEGKIVTGFTFSHQVYGEGFYTMDLLVKRLSDSEDRIPVMVSERLVDVTQDYVGQYVEIHGQFRSYNRHEEKHNRLVLSAFARELKFLEEEDSLAPVNQIFLDGYICKPPVYRKTPLGREIADVLLAVNRPYGKSDYIPCICWGRNARYASAFEVGGHVLIWGRIQSREYVKKLSETEAEKRIAYEVSVSKLEYVD